MASRMLSSDFEKTWRIVDFQTGGPTVSPLLLIYMCWKSNMISDRANHSIVDSVGALNCATNPNYPNTEPRMSRIKTRTGPSVSGSTVAKTHFSNQNKQVNPLSKNLIDPNHSLRRLTPSCNWDYSCGSLWRPIQLPIQD